MFNEMSIKLMLCQSITRYNIHKNYVLKKTKLDELLYKNPRIFMIGEMLKKT